LTSCVALFIQRLTQYHKLILVRRIRRSQHGNCVNSDVAKQMTNCLCIVFFSCKTSFKSNLKLIKSIQIQTCFYQVGVGLTTSTM